MKKFERIFYWVVILGIVGVVYYYYTSTGRNYDKLLKELRASEMTLDSLSLVNSMAITAIQEYQDRVDLLDIKLTEKDEEILRLKTKVAQSTREVEEWAGEQTVQYLVGRYPQANTPENFLNNDNIQKLILPEPIVKLTVVDLMEGDGAREEVNILQEKLILTEIKITNLDSIITNQNKITSNCDASMVVLSDNLNSCQILAAQQNTRIQTQSAQIKRLSKATIRNIGIVATFITIGQLIF